MPAGTGPIVGKQLYLSPGHAGINENDKVDELTRGVNGTKYGFATMD